MRLEDLQTGDLIAWRRDIPGQSKFSYLNLVRLATMSEFGHVSVVVRRGDEVRQAEATMPRIREADIPTEAKLFVIPMNLQMDHLEFEAFFNTKYGLKYSIRDALYGYLGWVPVEDDRYQCAELIVEFLSTRGIQLHNAYTPSRLVRRLVEQENRSIHRLQVS